MGKEKLSYLCIVNLKTIIEMTTQERKQNWKRIIEFVIVILTTIASFIGGNVSAKNGYKLVNTISCEQVK